MASHSSSIGSGVERRVALGQKRLVFDLAQKGAADIAGVVDVDHQRLRAAHQAERLADDLGELAVGEQDLGLAVVEHEGDRLGVEAGVERVEHRARHRNAEMRLDHRRDVGQHHRHRVVLADPALAQRRSQPPAPLRRLRPRVAQIVVDHRKLVREHVGRTKQKAQRRQRGVIRPVAVKPGQISVCHRFLLRFGLAAPILARH